MKPANRWQLLGYGSGSMAMSAYYLVSGSYLLFATAVLGLPASLAGMIMAVSTLWDAVIDVPLGWLSDHTRSRRFGRRHPFLLLGGMSITVLTALLWATPQGLGTTTTALWLLVTLIGLKTAIAAFIIPHTALGNEIVDGYDARTVVHGWRAVFIVVGMLLALAGSNLFFFRPTAEYPQGQLNPAAYPPLGLACAALVLLATVGAVAGTWRFIPRLQAEPTAVDTQHGGGWRRFAGLLLGDRNLRALALTILCIEPTLQLGIALNTHVYTYTYGLSGPQIGVLSLAMLAAMVLAQPLWIRLGRRLDKKPALIIAALVSLSGFVLGPLTHVAWGWFPLQPPSSVVVSLMPFQILAGAGAGAFFSLPFAMVGDCALAQQRETGQQVVGAYNGVYVFAYKLGSSIGIAGSGLLLHLIGFDPALPAQAADTRYWLAIAPALLMLAGTPLVLWMLNGYRLSRSAFAERLPAG